MVSATLYSTVTLHLTLHLCSAPVRAVCAHPKAPLEGEVESASWLPLGACGFGFKKIDAGEQLHSKYST